ncbi:hypothetical protein HK098_004542 [Nowakowskiella sp. JEL0407]|nr:hypothetical protein HK098_004542 [Nowakowskiella sp. JEL0407]
MNEMDEMFSVSLNTHSTTLYTLRLIFSPSPLSVPTTSLVQRAQVAKALYSNNLSAVITLKKLSEVKSILSQSHHDLHFPSQSDQLAKLSDTTFTEGDFIITKHSNLDTQIVFHLLYADLSTDLSNRSKLLLGYKAILKTAEKYSILNLKIPFPLFPFGFDLKEISGGNNSNSSSSSSNLLNTPAFPSPVILKRGEVLLKATKSVLLELSRIVKQSEFHTGSKTRWIQFVLFFDGNNQSLSNADLLVYKDLFAGIKDKIYEIFNTF